VGLVQLRREERRTSRVAQARSGADDGADDVLVPASDGVDWEKLRLSIPIEVDTPKIVRAKAKEAVATAKADDWRTPLQASRWARDAKLPEADEYLEKSIAAKPTFGSLSDKAKAQAEKGKKADAIATGEKALAVAKTQDPKPAPEAVAAFEKTLGEWKNKK
jgi:hypothetical protein